MSQLLRPNREPLYVRGRWDLMRRYAWIPYAFAAAVILLCASTAITLYLVNRLHNDINDERQRTDDIINGKIVLNLSRIDAQGGTVESLEERVARLERELRFFGGIVGPPGPIGPRGPAGPAGKDGITQIVIVPPGATPLPNPSASPGPLPPPSPVPVPPGLLGAICRIIHLPGVC